MRDGRRSRNACAYRKLMNPGPATSMPENISGSRGKAATSASATARGGLPASRAISSARLVVQSPCAGSRGIASSRRASRPSLHRPARFRASAKPSVSALQTKIQAPRVSPQPVEHVVLARLLVEDVDHDFHVVEQHPTPTLEPLDVPRAHPPLPEPVFDRLGDRLDLHLARSRADEEVVAYAVQLAQVEGDRRASLLGDGGARRLA